MDAFSQVLTEVTQAMIRCGIRYAVGGGVASATRGTWRTTFDIDVLAVIHPGQIQRLAAELGSHWYVDTDLILAAILAGRSFNVIHTRLAYKVDIFPATEEFHLTQIQRATIVPVGIQEISCLVTTAEDVLLAKLRWYKDGGETSAQQWNDIVGLITTNTALDTEYLRHWADRLRVADLLEKAQAAAG
jgi:hypothetical protein